MQLTRDVIIVGGGTAGWLAAARLGALSRGRLNITLIESPDIPTVGVGEGTWPSMRSTLQACGLSEIEVLRECDASLKQGTLFRGWRDGTPGDEYLHPFSLPADYGSCNLAQYWHSGAYRGVFGDAVTPQAAIAKAGKAPKAADTPDYAFAVNYGYHFDAVKFAALLSRHAVENFGVRHVLDEVVACRADADGFITEVILQQGSSVSGDFFLDCSGQRALLIEGHYGETLRSVRQILPNNRAIVTQVPYSSANEEIHSCTCSTAASAGWIWDIGLQSRRGVGYVHDGDMISQEQAQQELASYISRTVPAAISERLRYRTLQFDPGYRERPWRGNAVAIGLSGGFIEPLEASALAMIEQAVNFLCDSFPDCRELMGPASRRFNAKMRDHWDAILEFLKLHYVLSERDGDPYWRRARDMNGVPEALLDKLAMWRVRAPWHEDAPRLDGLFPVASYQYVWLGMGGHQRQEHASNSLTSNNSDIYRLDKALSSVRERGLQLQRALPSNRELLNTLIQSNSVTTAGTA